MEKTFVVQQMAYSPLLKNESIRFKEDEKFLIVGRFQFKSGLILYISTRTIDTPDMLKKVLPLLKSFKACFRLIKNQNLQYRLNSGVFGESESGKVVSISPDSETELSALITEIVKLTGEFKGPVVGNAQQLSNVLYVQKVATDMGGINLSKPTIESIPFTVSPEYQKRQRRNAIIGNYFLPAQLLRTSVKGNIYKGINLKKLSFTWCLIKQGNPVAFDDHFDRDMKDRLLWQKVIISQLQDTLSTPGFIDFFTKNGVSYLVLGFADGETLGHHVRALLKGTEWKKLEVPKKVKILNWFLNAVNLVETIHQKQIVHRDITDSNFIILQDDSICIIDFELSYSLLDQLPYPPFLFGTPGYISPEQTNCLFPDLRDDIYSIGALLAFVLTGCQPQEFLDTTQKIIRTKIQRLTFSDSLASLVIYCVQPSRKDRPTIQYIKNSVENYLEILKTMKHENLTMAI